MGESMIRTPREWDEGCRHCHGRGVVHKREQFSLWTPDEYKALMGEEFGVPTLDPKKHKGAELAPKNAIVCSAGPGSSIFEACKEGVSLAKRFGRPIAFEFNEAVAVCHATSVPEDVAKDWWLRAYGKTYEQSMADR